MPERRTVIMLMSLLAAMTLTSALLLVLEPRPTAPRTDISLRAMDRNPDGEAVLFQTSTPATTDRWQAIVIQDSRSLGGSARTLAQLHERQGRGGLGYHFVIGDGQGAEDGLIEVGFRWQRQLVGAHSHGANAEWLNRRAIGICLIGDGDRKPMTDAQVQTLTWLVQRLQRRFQIPADQVIVQTNRDAGQDSGVGALFPATWFRQQLADLTSP